MINMQIPYCSYLFRILFLSLLWLSACSTHIDHVAPIEEDSSLPEDAIPKTEPKSRYGNAKSYVVLGKRYYVLENSQGFSEEGIASWYGKKFHGKKTSNGEIYDMYAMTAAHKNLPLPTYVEVTNLQNQRKVVVRVNDRGPFHENRIIDLSFSAAKKLDMIKTGTGLVRVRALNPEGSTDTKQKPKKVTVQRGNTVFYIQIGAFHILRNAQTLKTSLSGLGHNSLHVSKGKVDGKPIYRVRFGPFIDIEKSDILVMQLRQHGITDHHITME